MSGRRDNRTILWALGLVAIVAAALTFSAIVGVIWPGEAKLTAWILCPRGRPDAFVVRDTEYAAGRSATNFTMYCVGARGEFTNVGWFRPAAILTIAHTVLAVGLVVAIRTCRVLRRKIRAAAAA